MARSNVSALQRIQVGVLGLLAVLLFVYIANLILERVPSRNASTAVEGAPAAGGPAKLKDEPLAELGVTPVVEENPETAKAAQSAPR